MVNEYPELTVARSERKNTGANIKDVFTSKNVRRENDQNESINEVNKSRVILGSLLFFYKSSVTISLPRVKVKEN